MVRGKHKNINRRITLHLPYSFDNHDLSSWRKLEFVEKLAKPVLATEK